MNPPGTSVAGSRSFVDAGTADRDQREFGGHETGVGRHETGVGRHDTSTEVIIENARAALTVSRISPAELQRTDQVIPISSLAESIAVGDEARDALALMSIAESHGHVAGSGQVLAGS